MAEAIQTKVIPQDHSLAAPASSKTKGSDNGDKQVTMTELLAAYALFKAIMNKGSIDQSKTLSTLFIAQDKSLKLSNQQMQKIVSEMKSMESEQNAAGILNKIGTVLAVVGMILCFTPLAPIGIGIMMAAGACMIASGAIQCDEGNKMNKIAQKQSAMLKDTAVAKHAQTTVTELDKQLKGTMSSKQSLEQTINDIIQNLGQASRSAGHQQRFYG